MLDPALDLLFGLARESYQIETRVLEFLARVVGHVAEPSQQAVCYWV